MYIDFSKNANKDLQKIIMYIRDGLFDDIIADKYKVLFKQEFLNLENIAGSMPISDKNITGHDNIREVRGLIT